MYVIKRILIKTKINLFNDEKQYLIMAVKCTFYERIYKYCYKDQGKTMSFFIITCHH